MFEVGDRVRAVRKFQTGVLEGEYGTIVDVWETGVSVYWDDYKSNRHTCKGRVPRGHGWHVPKEIIELAKPLDLGEFDSNFVPVSIEALLGG